MAHILDDGQQCITQLGFYLGTLQVASGGKCAHHKIDNRLRIGNYRAPRSGVFRNQLVRVHARRQRGNPDIQLQTRFVAHQPARIKRRRLLPVAIFARHIQAAQHGLPAGGVCVQRQHNARIAAAHQLQLAVAERRSHRRNHIHKPGLMRANHIHIAFHQHCFALFQHSLARKVQTVQQCAFRKQLRLRRVEVLGVVRRVQRPCAKPNCASVAVANGKHEAVAKTVARRPFISLVDQTRCRKVLDCVAALAKKLQAGIPAVRRVPQHKTLLGGGCYAAPLQILAHAARSRTVQQRIVIKVGGGSQYGAQPVLHCRLLGRARVGRSQLHPRTLGKLLHHLRKRKALAARNKLEDIPAGIARPEAAPALRVGPHIKGRRLLIGVEWAKPAVAAPGAAQLNALANQLDDVNALPDGVEI